MRRRRPGSCAARWATARRKDERALADRIEQRQGVRVRAAPGLAGAGAPGRGVAARRGRFPQGEPALLSQPRAGVPPARLRRHRQRRPVRDRGGVRLAHPRRAGPGAGADRRQEAGVPPHRAPADQRGDARADDRPVHAARGRARAARRRSVGECRRRLGNRDRPRHRRAAGHGQLPDIQPERVPRSPGSRAAQPRGAGSVRARVHFQDHHRERRARRACHQAHGPGGRQQGLDQFRVARHPRRSPLRRADVPGGGGEVEQRRHHQGRAAARRRERSAATSATSGSGARSRPTSAARTPASSGTGPRSHRARSPRRSSATRSA